MSLAATFDVKGWCPGTLRPMESGDGLIARVRPWCGAFSLAQASGLADIAERLGNGHIDLTRRANLQIRGLSEECLPALHNASLKGLLRRVIGKIFTLEVQGWCSEFETRNAASRQAVAESAR
jgi:sulfite reductase beta subunit-like hemoprotein